MNYLIIVLLVAACASKPYRCSYRHNDKVYCQVKENDRLWVPYVNH